MTSKLAMVKGKQAGTEYPLGDEVVLGREGGSKVDIAITDIKASRKHLKIVRNAGAYFLVDLGSRNGTLVNGKKVSRVKLKPGDRITIGKTEFEYRSPEDEQKKSRRAKAETDDAPALTETLSRPVQPQKSDEKRSGRVRHETFDPAVFSSGGRQGGGLLAEDLAQRPLSYKLMVAVASVGFLAVLGGLAYFLTTFAIG